MSAALKMADVAAPTPDFDCVAAEYRVIEASFDRAEANDDRLAAIRAWDTLRRRVETWQALVILRFNQDTRNEQFKKDRDLADEMRPKLTELDVAMMRKLAGSPHRPALESALGRQAFALWESQVTTYEPVIEQDMVDEAKLGGEYTELLSSAAFQVAGETLNLPGLAKYREHPDRALRERTERLRWSWFAENRPALDRIFDAQVAVRHAMADKLGFENFVGLAYKRLCRVDYTQSDVERFRDAVRDQVVPLADELRRRQAAQLGVDRLMHWDEGLFDPAGNPAPGGDHDWMLGRAQAMFDEMGGGLGDFFRLMNEGGFLDLKNREGKAGGGFCTSFPTYGFPFIYANFNGTKGDVEVFTHEIGHAFQNYCSRHQPLQDYLWPTYESCEIHSMGLEFLTWPHMEKFFGDAADRFRDIHLKQSLMLLPYEVAVDHFQHLVYQSPQASAAERHGMWQEMERTYLPWRDYGDLPHVADGGFWQLQRHIYLDPFYYIDYSLALTCALQFWSLARTDPDKALAAFVELCRRGGEAPFQELAASAGLKSPFADGCLEEVVAQVRAAIDV